MQRVGTDRGIGQSEPLKLILITMKILLEDVTGMKVLEYGFVLQDEPHISFATGKEKACTPLSWCTGCVHLSLTLCQLCSTQGQPRSLVNSIHQNYTNIQWKQKPGVVGLGFSSPNDRVTLKTKGRKET